MNEALVDGPLVKAPAGDGEVVLLPQGAELLDAAMNNARELADCRQRIGNIPLAELRTCARAALGLDTAAPAIATGHQVELYHPGVWVKNAVVTALAQRVKGQAVHLAVDTDSPKHLSLRWPGRALPITDDPRMMQSHWLGLVSAPGPEHLRTLIEAIGADMSAWSFEPVMVRALRNAAAAYGRPGSLPAFMLDLSRRIDAYAGLAPRVIVASELWQGRPFLSLACHVMARAHEFAVVYNAALAAYRTRHGVKSAGAPWPDLRVEPDRCEVPFWLDDLTAGRRQRAAVVRDRGAWAIEHDSDRHRLPEPADALAAAEALAAFLKSHRLRLSPRAMMLTAFMRLLASDVFVHGIGGALYDRVTDAVMGRFFGVAPPVFAVATATMFFPTARAAGRVDLGRIALEGRRLRHGWSDPAKRIMAQRIAGAPRRSPERQRLFDAMHAHLRGVVEGETYRSWLRRFEESRLEYERQKVLFDRELFYGIQPVERLRLLIERVNSMTGASAR